MKKKDKVKKRDWRKKRSRLVAPDKWLVEYVKHCVKVYGYVPDTTLIR